MLFVWKKELYELEYSNPYIETISNDKEPIRSINDIYNLTYDLSVTYDKSLIQIITVTVNLKEYNLLSAIKEVKNPTNVLTDSCNDFCYVFDLMNNSNSKTSASIIKESHEDANLYCLCIKNYIIRDSEILNINEIDDDKSLLLNSTSIKGITLEELNELEFTFSSFLKDTIYKYNENIQQ